MSRPRFSQLLLDSKLATADQVRAALEEQARTGEMLGSILYQRKIVTEEQVVQILAKVYGVPGVLVSKVTPDPELKKKIPKEIAERFRVLPLRQESRNLFLAVSNPNDSQMLQEIQFHTGSRLTLYVAMHKTLKDRMDRYYGAGLHEISIEMEPDEKAQKMVLTSLADTNIDEVEEGLATKDTQQAIKQAHMNAPSITPTWVNMDKSKKSVLVVDDDATIRSLLNDALRAKGYQVHLASQGREAVQKIQMSRPDLIILDAMLPEVHGFTICKTLKESERYRDIPVLIISAVYTGWRFMMDVKEQYGANEVLEKPFKVPDLLGKVKLLLDESESRLENFGAKKIDLSQRAEDLLKLGEDALRLNKIVEAKQLFQKGIEIDPLHPMLHYLLGKCFETQNDIFSAMASYEKSIEFDPHLFAAVKDLGILYQKNGFKRKAIEMWERAIQICPQPDLKEKIKSNLLKLLG